MSDFTIRGSWRAVLIIEIIVSPLIAFGLYFAFNQEIVGFLTCFALTVYLGLDVATSRVSLRDNIMSFHHFFRCVASVPVERLIVSEGKGGDLGLLPSIFLIDGDTNKVIAVLKKSYFSKVDTVKFIDAVSLAGADTRNIGS